MRKFLIGLVAMGFIAVACGSNNDTGAGATGSSGPTGATSSPTAAQTAADCAQSVTLTTPGTLTVGTDNPAYPPYFEGGTTNGSQWKLNDPSTGKGFESAVTYAVADKLGFGPDQVTWVVAPFTHDVRTRHEAMGLRDRADLVLARSAPRPSTCPTATGT